MSSRILVVFDTCALPEYYDDVHKIIAYPRDFIVTYDYGAGNIDDEAIKLLDDLEKQKSCEYPTLLVYIQDPRFRKGDTSPPSGPLPADSIVALTRLAYVKAVRRKTHDAAARYYLDLLLGGYPYDRGRSNAKLVADDLRARGCIPMKTYIALMHDAAGETIHSHEVDDEKGFSSVVENLSTEGSQFTRDTFWRIRRISKRTKSLVPLKAKPEIDAEISTETDDENKAQPYIASHDQSIISFHLRFHRAKEAATTEYRLRNIQLESSPKSFSDSGPSTFASRSFGLETVAVNIPSTSSLSQLEVRYRLETLLHKDDELNSFPYGPRLMFRVKYSKQLLRVTLAIATLLIATGLLAWAALATNDPMHPDPDLIWCRVLASVLGVLASLYAYYLWADDIALDKARR